MKLKYRGVCYYSISYMLLIEIASYYRDEIHAIKDKRSIQIS
jgi:hypothetical protein